MHPRGAVFDAVLDRTGGGPGVCPGSTRRRTTTVVVRLSRVPVCRRRCRTCSASPSGSRGTAGRSTCCSPPPARGRCSPGRRSAPRHRRRLLLDHGLPLRRRGACGSPPSGTAPPGLRAATGRIGPVAARRSSTPIGPVRDRADAVAPPPGRGRALPASSRRPTQVRSAGAARPVRDAPRARATGAAAHAVGQLRDEGLQQRPHGHADRRADGVGGTREPRGGAGVTGQQGQPRQPVEAVREPLLVAERAVQRGGTGEPVTGGAARPRRAARRAPAGRGASR